MVLSPRVVFPSIIIRRRRCTCYHMSIGRSISLLDAMRAERQGAYDRARPTYVANSLFALLRWHKATDSFIDQPPPPSLPSNNRSRRRSRPDGHAPPQSGTTPHPPPAASRIKDSDGWLCCGSAVTRRAQANMSSSHPGPAAHRRVAQKDLRHVAWLCMANG